MAAKMLENGRKRIRIVESGDSSPDEDGSNYSSSASDEVYTEKKFDNSINIPSVEVAAVAEVNANSGEPMRRSPPPHSDNITDANDAHSYELIDSKNLGDVIWRSSVLSFLLLDCRHSVNYISKRLKYSLNVSQPADINMVSENFTTKADVVKYLLEQHTNIIGYLNSPGFYDAIVVYDKASTEANLPRHLHLLLEAIAKWNSGTETKVSLLHGGFESIKREDGNFENNVVAFAWKFPASFETFGMDIAGTVDFQCRPLKCSKEMRIGEYLHHLDWAYVSIWFLTICKRQQKSLHSLKKELLDEQRKHVDTYYKDNMLPISKCSVCSEIFSGMIFQCVQGHLICRNCSGKFKTCKACGTPFAVGQAGRIRNVALEEMFSTKFTIPCANSSHGCNENVSYARLAEHRKICDGREKSDEVQQLEVYEEILQKEADKAIQRLEVASKGKEVMERKWLTAKMGEVPPINSDVMTRIVIKRNRLHTAKLAMEKEMLVKGAATTKGYMSA